MRRTLLSILVSRVSEALNLFVPGSREVESLLSIEGKYLNDSGVSPE
jgi:hypothetical protein